MESGRRKALLSGNIFRNGVLYLGAFGIPAAVMLVLLWQEAVS